MKSILPLRFAALVAHLVLEVLLLSNRDFNVRVCIPWHYTDSQYSSKDAEMVSAVSLSMVMLLVELAAFCTGISMLHAKQSLFSLCVHAIGSFLVGCFMLDGWDCSLFWWIFVLTTVVPVFTETCVVLRATLLSGGGAAAAGYHSK